MIRRLAVLGASSSATGECVVRAAVEKGLKVRVLLDHRPERLEGLSESLEVVEGDVTDIQRVKDTLEDQDGVVVLLESEGVQDPLSAACEGLKNIVAVMASLHIKAVSVHLSAQTESESEPRPREVLSKDYDNGVSKVLESSNLHWVAVVAPRVTDDDLSKGYTIVRDPSARYSPVSRRDLATFLIECLSMPERYQKTVEIAGFAKR